MRGAGPLRLPSGASGSGPLPWLHNCWRIAYNLHLAYRLVKGPDRRSGWALVQDSSRGSAGRDQLLDVLKEPVHQPRVLHEDREGLPGLERIHRFDEFIVKSGLGDSLGWLSDEVPDPLEHQRLLCVVLPDLIRLPIHLLRHGCHLSIQVGVFRIDSIKLLFRQVELPPVRPVRQLPEYVSGSAVVESLVHSSGDVLQPVVLQLEVL